MVEWLIQRFIQNPDQYECANVRLAYGKLSGYVGVICNLLLFFMKLVVAYLSHSISLLSDSFNNLSDCFACMITLTGYHIATKPADKEHPFGHGRVEYIVGFILSIIIFLFAVELFKNSIEHLFLPTSIRLSWVYLIVFILSVGIKFWLGYFNQNLANRIHNIAMKTAARDSYNDVISTVAAFLGMLLSFIFPSIPFDSIFGLVVAIFICYTGYGIAKEIIDKLIGAPTDSALFDAVKKLIFSNSNVKGVHDLMIHDYGFGRRIGSAHVELDSDMLFVDAHEIVDVLEHKISTEMNMLFTLHMDPVQTNDPLRSKYLRQVRNIVTGIDKHLTIHDFRIVKKHNEYNFIFDILKPFQFGMKNEVLKQKIDMELQKESIRIHTIIYFDEG